MFGNKKTRRVLSSLVLSGFAVYIIRLYFSGTITLYIHPRYSIFAVAMAIIALVVFILSLIYELKANKKETLHTHERASRGIVINLTVLVVLCLAFLLPARPLSDQAIGERSVQIPSYGDTVSDDCPDYRAETIVGWVNEISAYPVLCYSGDQITVTGFISNSPDLAASAGMFYLARAGVACCTIDTRVYALPIAAAIPEQSSDSQWFRISGKLELRTFGGERQLTVVPSSVEPIATPDNPYEYFS